MPVVKTDLALRREPFARPFGFKGSAFHEKWCPIARLVDEAGRDAVGVGGLTPLWSDARVFQAHTEVGGNTLQLAVTEKALQLATDREWDDPIALHDAIIDEVHDYARVVTGFADLRMTFSLVALSALDYAAWLLHAKRSNIETFDDLIPETFRPHLLARQEHVALAPAVGYTLPMDRLRGILESGAYVLKIKIGHPGTEEEMLSKDMDWLDRIHALAAGFETEMTDSGHVLYYLDANGRYELKESMASLLAHAERNGYLDRVILIEEPFADPDAVDVNDLPACFAGDESVESTADIETRVQQGYKAFAIKTAGKTVSRCFRMVKAATEAGAVPFVADNACVPVMVEWNKTFAARLPSFPGVKGGIMESNGPENYGQWDKLLDELPDPKAGWLRPRNGAFVLDDEYYRKSGGIFETLAAYSGLFR